MFFVISFYQSPGYFFSDGIFIEEFLQNKLNRYFFLVFLNLHATPGLFVWVVMENSPFSDLHFFDAEESIDARSETHFWIFPKKRTLSVKQQY